ncbi:PREDICTED: myosin light chain kinase 2, skeletal/cardiac muscle [Acanthisitta chloris]|nr:PREDICTED: myosin light chain kinase 2, skeletal/cardiac muscle [Acanthisitta chloris]
MEQGDGADDAGTGGTGGTAPTEAEGSTAPQAAQPQGGTAPAASADEPGQEKAEVDAGGGKAEPARETAPAVPEPREGQQAVPAEEDSAVQHSGRQESSDGGQAASVGEKMPTGTQGVEKDGKDEPGKKKAPAAGDLKGGKAAPMEEKAPAAAKAQDRKKDEPRKKGPAAVKAQDRGKDEPGKKKAPAAGELKGGKAPAAAEAQDGGKDEPREEKAPPAGQSEGEKVVPMEGKGLTVTEAQDGGKDEPRKEQAPGESGADGGGKSEPMEKALPVAAESEGGKAKLMEETALAATQAQDGGKEEPAKEKTTVIVKDKVPATTNALDAGKQTANAEQAPVENKSAKEKAPTAAKAQGGANKVVKTEKAPAAKKAPNAAKEEPAKEKAIIPAKEKAPDAAKAQDGEKVAAKAEKTPVAKVAQGGGKKEPAKEKAPSTVKMQDGGKKTANVEKSTVASKAGDGGKDPAKEKIPAAAKAQGEGKEVPKEAEGQPPRVPEPPRPVLLQSLSCPAICHREDQPRADVAEMEMIPEETMVAEPRAGPTAPSALGDLQPSELPGTPQERTLPSATGQPPDPAGVKEQPGGQPSLKEEKPPPSPYLTSDFGKEDPFEILDDIPPPPAPFPHRTVTLHSASVSSLFSLNSKDILGGGKFGEVHTCTEKQTGLKLAAKVIRKQGAKDKEMVLLEIDVMNQLNHHNLIQLYDAIETSREIILFMEFVEGGELFERIIDDDYHLREVDCMVFVRQICEGIRFMHHMCVLHLDLKPENILCVAATGHMVKIIDFGLARRYNPNEKLKVNFGTPEFLSPEVVNYEQVSYSTDMWSMGVITYMLLSGLSPFLGDDDTETLNNVLAANWYFDEETFESISDEAKDFVSNLIIKDKSARMSADQCLQHPWLNNLAEKAKRSNLRLKSQVLLKKYVMRRRWKKNFIGVCAANRFRKITSSGSLTALGV